MVGAGGERGLFSHKKSNDSFSRCNDKMLETLKNTESNGFGSKVKEIKT